MRVKTEELKGAALDWAVAHATKAWEFAHKWYPTMTLDPKFSGVQDEAIDGMIYLVPRNPFRQSPQPFNPSRWWEHGGPLIGERVTALAKNERGVWWAHAGNHVGYGSCPLIASMRAIVAGELGEMVEIPDAMSGFLAVFSLRG